VLSFILFTQFKSRVAPFFGCGAKGMYVYGRRDVQMVRAVGGREVRGEGR
jgi:hypothetical protein